MLVTFTCPVYADITMFGDVAIELIKLMGHSGTVPGALGADEVQPALDRLQASIEALPPPSESEGPEEGEGGESVVSLAHRALPLIELLEAAAREKSYVMWNKNK